MSERNPGISNRDQTRSVVDFWVVWCVFDRSSGCRMYRWLVADTDGLFCQAECFRESSLAIELPIDSSACRCYSVDGFLGAALVPNDDWTTNGGSFVPCLDTRMPLQNGHFDTPLMNAVGDLMELLCCSCVCWQCHWNAHSEVDWFSGRSQCSAEHVSEGHT